MSTTNPVADEFGKAAAHYHQHADIPKKVAEGLFASLKPWQDIVPPGPILEIGCGTGFLTMFLLRHFPKREFVISDASPEMLEFCKKSIEEEGLLRENIHFEVIDVDSYTFPKEKYAMVIGNFVAHWFKDTGIGLEKLADSVMRGGLLLTSFPGEKSFPNWYENCLELGLPHTAHPLPNVERVSIGLSLGPQQIDYYENDLAQDFKSSLEFFQYLKRNGMGFTNHQKSLNVKQMRLLLKHWDKKEGEIVRIKWHIIYLAAKKDW